MLSESSSSVDNQYASFEAYGLKAEFVEKTLRPLFEKYGEGLSLPAKKSIMNAFLNEIKPALQKVDIYRQRRDLYMASEKELSEQFGKDEGGKNAFLVQEIFENNARLLLPNAIALARRALEPKTELGKFYFDSAIFPEFKASIQVLDIQSGLNLWKKINDAVSKGINIGDRSVRKGLYIELIESINPKGKIWMIQMIKSGNWEKAKDVEGYTTITKEDGTNVHVFQLVQEYERNLNTFLAKNGELYKIRSDLSSKNKLPHDTIFFQNILPEVDFSPPNHVKGTLNQVHYYLFMIFGGELLEDAIHGIGRDGTSFDAQERLSRLGLGALSLIGGTKLGSSFIPDKWKFDAFGKSIESLMMASNALEKAQILALLSRLFGAKHPFVTKLAHI